MNQVRETIIALNKKVVEGQAEYYAGNPTMTDAEYDSLEGQLTALVNANKEFASLATALVKVGAEANSALRIPHARVMLSIENYYTPESFFEASKNYGTWVLVEPKFDGNSCELVFIDGVLTRAVSRGDGSSGEDMTAQVKACKKIPQHIITKIHDLRIRGEIVMRNSELARINALGGRQYANARNLVAGTLKQLDLSIVRSRELILMPWDMYSPTEDNLLSDSAYDRMKLAFNFGFPHPEGMKVQSGQVLAELDRILKINEGSDITADGVVIKADSHKVRNLLGVATKFTRYQNCYKSQNQIGITYLRSVEWNVGRTGKVTPVGIVDPITLGGATITRVTLNNETWIQVLGLKINSKVELIRSGDCIPLITAVLDAHMTSNLKEIVFPTKCPSCGSILKLDPTAEIVQRFCDNSNCAGKAAEQFAYVGNRETLEIDNLGDSMAAELVAQGITSLADLFEFGNKSLNLAASFSKTKQNDLALVSHFVTSGFRSGVNTLKMVKSLQVAKTATWDRWIAALGISFIGHSLGEDISKALNLDPENMKNLPKLLLTLPKLNLDKLGEVKIASIVDWAKDKNNIQFCTRLYNVGVRPTPLTAPKKVAGATLAGTEFCITGELSIGTRKEVEKKLEALGAIALSDVRSTCNLVIVGDKPGSKLAKAQKKGIKIVDETWLRKVLSL